MLRCAVDVGANLVPADEALQDAGPEAPNSTAKPPHVMAAAAMAAPVASAVLARSFAHETRDPMSPPNIMFHTVPVCVPRVAALSHRRAPFLLRRFSCAVYSCRIFRAGPAGRRSPAPRRRRIGSKETLLLRGDNHDGRPKVPLSAMTSGGGPLVLEPAVAAAVEEQRPARLVLVQIVHAADHDDVIARLVLGLG